MSNKFVVEGGLKISSGKFFELSGYDVDAISNSTTLVGDSSAALVTEYAVKSYVDSQLGASDIDLKLDGNTLTSIDQSTGKLGLSSTANEIEISYAHDGTDGVFTLGLPDDVTIGQDLTVSRNIDVSGTLAAGNSTISGTISSSGTITGATGSMFGTLTVADGSLTDSSGAISFGDENLSTTGTLDAANTVINGTLSASGNTELDGTLNVDGASTLNGAVTLGDATTDTIAFSGHVGTPIVPDTDSTYDLGSASSLWSNIYADNLVGNATEMIISADGTETSLSNDAADTLSIHASAGAYFSGDVNVSGDVKGTGTDMVISADDDVVSLGGADSLTLNAAGGIFTADVMTLSAGYEMEHMKKDEFSVSMTGSAATCFTFDDSTYTSAKVVAKVKNGTDVTSKELLIVSNGTDVSIVEYGTVSVGTEISQTWAGSSSAGTCTITCDASAGTMVGSFELIK